MKKKFNIILLFIILCFFVSPLFALSNSEAKLTQLVEKHILSKNPVWADLEIKINFKGAEKIFTKLADLPENVEFNILETYKDYKPVGNVIVPIEIKTDESTEKIFLRAKVEVLQNVVVAKEVIRRGNLIGFDQLAVQKRDIAMMPEKYFSTTEGVVSKEAKTTIPRKSIVFDWMVKRVPHVRRGDQVALLVKAKNLSIKTSGVILQDGYLGGIVRVKAKDGKNPLSGILVSNTEVEVWLK